MMRAILTFDVGTTSMKACLFDESLALRAACSREYLLDTPRSGIVEFDAEGYWDALCDSVRTLTSGGASAADIAVISITTQGETLIPIDASGRALTKAIVWFDARASDQAAALGERLGEDAFYQSTGLQELTGATPIAKLMWYKQALPDIYARTHKFLLLEDYLIHRLTGEAVSNHSLLSSTGYFDIRTNTYDAAILGAAGIDATKLARPMPCGALAGRVTEQAARETGLLPGTPVATAAMDQICGMIGAGNVAEGIVTETTGTCLTVAATVRNPDFSHPSRPYIYRHFDDQFVYLPYNQTAAIVLKWFRDTFLPSLDAEAAARGVSAYQIMDSMAGEVPPGADGLLLLPHFMGKLVPDTIPDFKGAFLGVSLNCTAAHFVRAILEGVAFMLRENLDFLAQLGVRPTEIRSLGGGSVSALWCAIKADVVGKAVVPMPVAESGSLGAAMLGLRALDSSVDVTQMAGRIATGGARYLPNAQNAAAYASAYAQYAAACDLVGQLYRPR